MKLCEEMKRLQWCGLEKLEHQHWLLYGAFEISTDKGVGKQKFGCLKRDTSYCLNCLLQVSQAKFVVLLVNSKVLSQASLLTFTGKNVLQFAGHEYLAKMGRFFSRGRNLPQRALTILAKFGLIASETSYGALRAWERVSNKPQASPGSVTSLT